MEERICERDDEDIETTR